MRTTHLQEPRALPDSLQSSCGQVSIAGVELRCLRTGAGRPVVLLHTLRTQLEMFSGVLERLDPASVEMVAIDLPGHARALQSLCREWRSFVAARERYPHIDVPVTLVYGDHDWSRPVERDGNRLAIPAAQFITLEHCGHFASLEHPAAIARLITSELA